ncbi:hypothetical protein ACVWY5_001184 [Bradyrhizobium sp. USDA 3256]
MEKTVKRRALCLGLFLACMTEWRVLFLVNCNIPGPQYYTGNGVIAFERREGQDWERQSLFAKRIATFPPGSWFDHIESNERNVQESAKASAN